MALSTVSPSEAQWFHDFRAQRRNENFRKVLGGLGAAAGAYKGGVPGALAMSAHLNPPRPSAAEQEQKRLQMKQEILQSILNMQTERMKATSSMLGGGWSSLGTLIPTILKAMLQARGVSGSDAEAGVATGFNAGAASITNKFMEEATKEIKGPNAGAMRNAMATLQSQNLQTIKDPDKLIDIIFRELQLQETLRRTGTEDAQATAYAYLQMVRSMLDTMEPGKFDSILERYAKDGRVGYIKAWLDESARYPEMVQAAEAARVGAARAAYEEGIANLVRMSQAGQMGPNTDAVNQAIQDTVKTVKDLGLDVNPTQTLDPTRVETTLDRVMPVQQQQRTIDEYMGLLDKIDAMGTSDSAKAMKAKYFASPQFQAFKEQRRFQTNEEAWNAFRQEASRAYSRMRQADRAMNSAYLQGEIPPPAPSQAEPAQVAPEQPTPDPTPEPPAGDSPPPTPPVNLPKYAIGPDQQIVVLDGGRYRIASDEEALAMSPEEEAALAAVPEAKPAAPEAPAATPEAKPEEPAKPAEPPRQPTYELPERVDTPLPGIGRALHDVGFTLAHPSQQIQRALGQALQREPKREKKKEAANYFGEGKKGMEQQLNPIPAEQQMGPSDIDLQEKIRRSRREALLKALGAQNPAVAP